MTLEALGQLFELHTKEYLKFEAIVNPMHTRPDLCAFLMLAALVPGEGDLVSAAEHDIIYLDTNCEKLAGVITSDEVRDLHRCGVSFSAEYACLSLFV